MRRARTWLLLCFGCLLGCCAGIAAAEPSSREAGGSYDAGSYEALVDRLITSDPQDWCAFGSCPRPAPPEPSGGSAASSYEAYADKVVATDRNYERVGVSVYGWLSINNFQQLVEASARNPDFCIRFLSDKKHSERQRHVAILSMYGLSIDQHVVFVRNLAKLRDKALISPEELEYALFPRFSVDMIYENYQDERIRLLLGEIEARDDIRPGLKSEIASIPGTEVLEGTSIIRYCIVAIGVACGWRFVGSIRLVPDDTGSDPVVQLYEDHVRRSITDRGYAAELFREGTLKFAQIQSYCNGLSARALEFKAARTGFAWGMIFMAIRLLNVVCLAALVVFPAHSRILPGPNEKIAAITTYLQFITEDQRVNQRTMTQFAAAKNRSAGKR